MANKRLAPALTPEARENQLVALAMNLAEKQLREGTASAQVITHFLKIGSMKEQDERTLKQVQANLMGAKIETLESAKHSEELYAQAIEAMQHYGGDNDD